MTYVFVTSAGLLLLCEIVNLVQIKKPVFITPRGLNIYQRDQDLLRGLFLRGMNGLILHLLMNELIILPATTSFIMGPEVISVFVMCLCLFLNIDRSYYIMSTLCYYCCCFVAITYSRVLLSKFVYENLLFTN